MFLFSCLEWIISLPFHWIGQEHYHWDAWVAQSVEHLTLDFGSGHDLTGSWDWALHRAPCWKWSLVRILSLPLALPLLHKCAFWLSTTTKQKQNKQNQNPIIYWLASSCSSPHVSLLILLVLCLFIEVWLPCKKLDIFNVYNSECGDTYTHIILNSWILRFFSIIMKYYFKPILLYLKGYIIGRLVNRYAQSTWLI